MSNSNWRSYKLEELGFVGRGKSKRRPRNDPSLYGGPYPFVQTGDIKSANLYLREHTQTYSEIGLAQSKLWNPGTLCITIAANIAETAILGIKACFPDSVIGFIADPTKSDVRFIKYYVDYIKLRIQNVSQGTTQDNLSMEKLRAFDFIVPGIELQREIANVLSAYDDLIENNTRRIAILEEMAQALYREWFVHFRFPGHESVALVEGGNGRLPEGWEVRPFSEIADVLSGGTPKTHVPEYWGGEIPFFSPKDHNGSFFVSQTERYITELGLRKCSSKLYPPNTVFITARGTVGKMIMPSVYMAMNQSCYALQGRDGMHQHYIFLSIMNLVEQLKQRAHGAVFDTIIVDTFSKLETVKPPPDILNKFVTVVTPMFNLIRNLLDKNANLRQTRDLLLPRLISGELDVSRL